MTFGPIKLTPGKPELMTSIGAPYHGVAVEGTLDLSASGGPVITGIVVSNCWNNTLRNPNRTLPTRTAPELVLDAASGKSYKDYALRPCANLHGKILSFTDKSYYFDSRGYLWEVDFDNVDLNVTANTITGTAQFTRYLHIGTAADFGSPVTSNAISFTGAACSDPAWPIAGAIGLQLYDFTPTGEKVILGGSRGIYEATISDTIDEGGVGSPNPYPYGGGTIEFTLTFVKLKGRADLIGNLDFSITNNLVVRKMISGVLEPDPDTQCANFGGPGGTDLCAHDSNGGTDVRTTIAEVEDLIFYANYTTADVVTYWSRSELISATEDFALTPGTSASSLYVESVTWDRVLKRNGTTVDTVTFTGTRTTTNTYAGSIGAGTNTSTTDSSIDASVTGFPSGATGSYTETLAAPFGNPDWVAKNSKYANDPVLDYAKGSVDDIRQAFNGFTDPSSLIIRGEFNGPNGDSRPWSIEMSAGPATQFEHVWHGNLRLLSNKIFGLYTAKGLVVQGASSLDVNSYTGVKLRTIYSPQSSQAPDATSRTPADSDFGTTLAYNPELGTWSVSAWLGTRWDKRVFV